MANRKLDAAELELARELLIQVRSRLNQLAGEDSALRFALNRKVFKELMYDERGKPAIRVALKKRKRKTQGGLCAVCQQTLPDTDVHLDRYEAMLGYTDGNTRLLCRPCDLKIQTERGFA